MKKINYIHIEDGLVGFCADADGWCIDQDGNEHHFNKGLMESVNDEPCSKYFNGQYSWRKDGLYHRLNEPARILKEGVEYWFNGKRHRLNGPAVTGSHVHSDQYWINGIRLTEREFRTLPKDDNNNLHSQFLVSIGTKKTPVEFYFWHGQFCETEQEFNYLKLEDKLSSNAVSNKKKKI